jgi:hypothetical protein
MKNLEKLLCDKAETSAGGFQYCDNRECPYGVPRLNFAYGSVCTIADYRKHISRFPPTLSAERVEVLK